MPEDEPDVVLEGGSDQGPMHPPEPGVAPEGVPKEGPTPPLEKGWEKKLRIETGEGDRSREVSPAGGSAKSARKGGSRTQPGGVMALCKEVVLSLSAHRAGHLFKDIDYESFPGGDQIERQLDLNTIRHHVDDGVYDAEGSAAFYSDVQAMCDNVTAAFPPESGEHVAATALRAFAHGEMGLVWKTEEMIRDGARSSRRPPPKFEPFQATPRKSLLGKSEPGAVPGGGTGKASRPQSKGRSRLGGTPTGTPREEEREDGSGKEGVEEAKEQGPGGGVETKEGNKKEKGGAKVAETPKGGAGGKGKSAPKAEKETPAEEKGSTPKGDGKGGSKQKAKSGTDGGAAKLSEKTPPKPANANPESIGDATSAGDNKGKRPAKGKGSPKTEPKPPSKSHKKQPPTPKSEPAKRTGGGVKSLQAAKASPAGEAQQIEGAKKDKGVKRALETTTEPEKKKPIKKARR